jgi:hypothetical protein
MASTHDSHDALITARFRRPRLAWAALFAAFAVIVFLWLMLNPDYFVGRSTPRFIRGSGLARHLSGWRLQVVVFFGMTFYGLVLARLGLQFRRTEPALSIRASGIRLHSSFHATEIPWRLVDRASVNPLGWLILSLKEPLAVWGMPWRTRTIRLQTRLTDMTAAAIRDAIDDRLSRSARR